MTKDAYYFSHDSNAKDDPKCVLLIEQIGLEGYGIFWVLVETLRDQPDYKYPFRLVPAIARKYNTTVEKVISVIKNYELFHTDEDNFFFSKSLIKRMQIYEFNKLERVTKAKKAALKRWDAQAMLKQCSSNANAMLSDAKKVKYSKVNKSKVNDTKEKESKVEEIILDSEKRRIIGEWLEQFWNIYPKKIKKALVEQIFFDKFFNIHSIDQMVLLQNTIMDAVEKQKPHWKEPEYIPGPDKWLIDERWKDEITKPKTAEEKEKEFIERMKLSLNE